LDLDDLIMFDGLASKIHVFLDLDVYSSSRKLNEMKVVLHQEMKNQIVIKIKRNNNIEQIKSAAFKKIVCLLFSISK